MKLRNKKTGEITNLSKIYDKYNTFEELIEDWEDYEEPSGYWYIDFDGDVLSCVEPFDDETEENRKQIGNYFETEEEAEKAVEKLKAWKRLKDKGFRFTITPGVGSLDVDPDKFQIEINADMPAKWFCCDAVHKDLDACFGGEE